MDDTAGAPAGGDQYLGLFQGQGIFPAIDHFRQLGLLAAGRAQEDAVGIAIVLPELDVQGTLIVRHCQYYFYLPSAVVRAAGTGFYQSTPEVTLTIPSTAAKVISVGAYDSTYEAYADFSGKTDKQRLL